MTNTRRFFRLLTGAALVFGAANAAPATSPIGMAVSSGTLLVDHTRVSGSATIFAGSTVDTAAASSTVRLDSGARLRLSPETRVQIYPDHAVMDSGLGEFNAVKGYAVEARMLRVSAGSNEAISRVRVNAGRSVTVASVRGTIRVANLAGVVVANVEAGRSMDFEPQSDVSMVAVQATGCLLVKSSKPVIVDQTTNVVLELEGAALASQIGNRVEITGLAEQTPSSVEGATQLVKVSGFKLVAKGGCSAVAKKLGASVAVAALAGGAAAGASSAGAAGTAAAGTAAAGTAAGAGGATAAAAATGISVTTAVSVAGGVAAAATVGGLAATGSLPGQSSSEPSASR